MLFIRMLLSSLMTVLLEVGIDVGLCNCDIEFHDSHTEEYFCNT